MLALAMMVWCGVSSSAVIAMQKSPSAVYTTTDARIAQAISCTPPNSAAGDVENPSFSSVAFQRFVCRASSRGSSSGWIGREIRSDRVPPQRFGQLLALSMARARACLANDGLRLGTVMASVITSSTCLRIIASIFAAQQELEMVRLIVRYAMGCGLL